MEKKEEEKDRNNEGHNDWRSWRGVTKKRAKEKYEKKKEGERIQRELREGTIKGILFVPHTKQSTVAKRIRQNLSKFEEISMLRIRVVERAGEKLVDCLHKSNPWEATDCKREGCKFCCDEKLVGQCKKTCVVYEVECLNCKATIDKEESQNRELVGGEEKENSKTGEKRKRQEKMELPVKSSARSVKYIGETSRSAFERQQEH